MINKRHVAIGRCKECGSLIVSMAGGHFSQCECKKCFIDQERFGGLYCRLGNPDLLDFYEQICPKTCDCSHEHKLNKKFDEWEDLKDYLKKTYKIYWNERAFNYIPRKKKTI